MPAIEQVPSAPPSRRLNDDQELERFKDRVPLVPLATERYGYEVTDKARNNAWHRLERGPEMIIVSVKEGRDVYVNPHDAKDSGSVVDFVKTRGNLNLGQARQYFRHYLGENGPESDRHAYERRPGPQGLSERQAVRGPDANLPDDPTDRREELLRRVLGVQPRLTDRQFLHDRGLSDDTISAPAFTGRVFTSQNGPYKNTVFPLVNESGFSSYEEKNHNFKSVMPGVKDGVWASHASGGKDRPVERLVVGEAALDMMSKYQLEQPTGAGPNTMYLATSGTVSRLQTELIQKIIDRQRPLQLVLANDNDPAGARFNLNFYNDLRAPRSGQDVGAGLGEAPTQTPGNVSWRATRSGDYRTDLKITFDTEKAFQGRAAVLNLRERVDAWQQEGGESSATMSVLSTGSERTVARVSVTNDHLPNLRTLVEELYARREAALPEAQRAPAGYVVIETSRSKDYNQDLMEAAQASNLARARQQAGFDEVAPAAPARETLAPLPSRQPHPVERTVLLDVHEEVRRGHARRVEHELLRAGASVTRQVREDAAGTPDTEFTRLTAQYLVTQPAAERAAIGVALRVAGHVPGVTVIESPEQAQERSSTTGPAGAFVAPAHQLHAAREAFAQAVVPVAIALKAQGYERHATQLTEIARGVQQEPHALPWREHTQDAFSRALDVASKLPEAPIAAVGQLRNATSDLNLQHQRVNELGGSEGLRATIRVLEPAEAGPARAVAIWKDLKAEGGGVGSLTERAVATGMVERTFPLRYPLEAGPAVEGLHRVLGAAERSPGVAVEEAAEARTLRQATGPLGPGAAASPYLPGPDTAPAWLMLAVTAGEPAARSEVEKLRHAGAVLSPIEGHPRDEKTQVLSFYRFDPRAAELSESLQALGRSGAVQLYDLTQRGDVPAGAGYHVATVRLTEAQDAARRTPDVLDDLRANGVLVQEPRRVAAPTGFTREEFQVAYAGYPNPAGVDDVLTALKRSPGAEVEESTADQRAREELARAQREAELERQRAAEVAQRSPTAQQEREQQDRALSGALLGLAGAEMGERQYAAPGWRQVVLRDRSDDELGEMRAALAAVGAQVGGRVPSATGPGQFEVTASYHPAAAAEPPILAALERLRPGHELVALERAPGESATAPPQLAASAAVGETTTEVAAWRTLIVGVVEQAEPGRAPGAAADLAARLEQAGAQVGHLAPPAAWGTQGLQRQEFTVSYPVGPELGAPGGVGETLLVAGQQPGVTFREPLSQQREREQALPGPSSGQVVEAPVGPPRGPGHWQLGVVETTDADATQPGSRTERIRADLLAAGASVGGGAKQSELHYSYHTQQPELAKVNEILERAAASPGVSVREQNQGQLGPELSPREGQFNQALITVEAAPAAPDRGRGQAERLSQALGRAGAIVGEAKEANGHVEVPVSYHTLSPTIRQINETLDRASQAGGVTVQEAGEDRSARLRAAQQPVLPGPVPTPGREREFER